MPGDDLAGPILQINRIGSLRDRFAPFFVNKVCASRKPEFFCVANGARMDLLAGVDCTGGANWRENERVRSDAARLEITAVVEPNDKLMFVDRLAACRIDRSIADDGDGSDFSMLNSHRPHPHCGFGKL